MSRTFIYIGDADDELVEKLHTLDCDMVVASTCHSAKELMSQVSPDLIIVHVKNKTSLNNDSLGPIRKLKLHAETACMPILFVMPLDDADLRLQVLKAGVNDFLSSPVDFEELKLRIDNYSRIADRRNEVLGENIKLKKELYLKLSEIKTSSCSIKEAYGEVIMKLSLAAEYKDPETGDHIHRVAYYCRALAASMGFDDKYQEGIFFAAPMHDIGKIGIPDNILLKRGALNDKEWAIMKSHTEIGHAILTEPKDSTLAMAQDIALSHHEKYDGSGYPFGLKGDAIPLPARIMTVADVYDALRSERPYKRGFSHEDSLEIMLKGDSRVKSSHFDPEIMAIFAKYHEMIEDIYETGVYR